MSISYNEPITIGRHVTATNLNCTGMDSPEDGDQSWKTAPGADHGGGTFPVRRSMLSDLPARLSLAISTATSPKSLQRSGDMRDLGICLNSIRTVS
jgi:hypothetical protein